MMSAELQKLHTIKGMLITIYSELMKIEGAIDCMIKMERLEKDLASALTCVDEMIVIRLPQTLEPTAGKYSQT